MRAAWISIASLLIIALSAPDAQAFRKRRRNPRNTGDMFCDYVDIDNWLAFPVTHDGTAMVHGISAWYQPYDHLGFGTGFSWVLNEDRIAAPGGFVLKLSSGTGTVMKVRKGFGASLNVYGMLGINPSGRGNEDRQRAYAIGRAYTNDLLSFVPNSAVLGADAVGSIWMSQTMFVASCGPRFALPLGDHDGSNRLTALSYSASLNFGFGDWRGAWGLYFGLGGLKEFSREADHLFELGAGLAFWIGAIDLAPSVSVWAPVIGQDAGIKLSVLLSVVWSFDARIKKQDKRDLLPPSPTTALKPPF